jgi:Spy/CpxP family protein refolding chaperone
MNAVAKFWVLSLTILLGASLVTDCYAQPPGGGGGGRGRGFGGGFGGVAGLLGMDEVKKEIKLTDEQADEVKKFSEEARKGIDFSNLRDASREERAEAVKAMQSANEKIDEELPSILDPDQFKRLLGLYAQRSGVEALINKQVAKELGLSDETNEKLKAKDEETRPRFDRQDGPPDFAAMQEARTKRLEAMEAILTPEEKEKFEALKGEKFEFPSRGFGRGGQGGEGRRGEGRRGGDNN